MELATVLNVLCSSAFVSIYFAFSGTRLFRNKMPKTLFNVLIIIFLFLFISINYLVVDNMVKSGILYIVVLIAYRLLFHKSMIQCAIASFVAYLGTGLGEVLFIAVISLLNLFGIFPSVTNLGGDALANSIIVLFSTLFIFLIYRPANKMLEKIKEHNKFTIIITFSLLLVAICVLFYKLSFHKYEVDSYLIFNLVLIIALSYISVVIIKQHYDKTKLSDEYEKYVEYSKQSEKLVDLYSVSQHENKNELIIIKSMVHKTNKELLEYLDEIITSKDYFDESWIRHLQYLPFGGLKGIIHNKISEMKDNGINALLNISKDIENSKLKELSIKENNQLSKILGVFLDNAKEAAFLSEDKEVSVSVYIDDSDIVFEISNTYIGDIDLSKIYTIGGTTKGKGRGYGLVLVDSIIKENKIFTNEVKKVDKYFVQVLKIKTKK